MNEPKGHAGKGGGKTNPLAAAGETDGEDRKFAASSTVKSSQAKTAQVKPALRVDSSKINEPAAPPIEIAPAPKSAIEIEVVAEPTLAEMIEAAVAPDALSAMPAAGAPAPTPAAVTAAAADAAPVPARPAKSEVVRPTPDPVAAFPVAPVTTRGSTDMATTFDAATTPVAAAQKVQAMFGGLNDRAKTAMEKSTKLGEELSELTKGNVEAIVAAGKIAAKGAETMAQEAGEYGKKNLESATAMFKSLASAKSPTELLQLQSDFAKSSFDSAVAEASKLSEAWVKLAGEMVQPLSNRYAVAADKLKSAAL